MTHDEYVAYAIDKRFIREFGMKTSECVALTKDYNEKVFGKRPGSFNGSAWNCWKNNNSFDLGMYERIEYKPGLVPPVGASLFWNTTYNPVYGHTAIAHTGSDKEVLAIMEQNGAGKPGDGVGDEIRLRRMKYDNLAGWYQLKDSKEPMTVIEEVWNRMPKEHRLYTGYDDNEKISGADVRRLVDLSFYNKGL